MRADQEFLIIALVLMMGMNACLRTRVWARPWIMRRKRFGAYHALLQELMDEDCEAFHNFVRMDKDTFEVLLNKVKPIIKKRNTFFREAIPAGERLALTLRFLASGDSFASLEYLYRIPKSTISGIVRETCRAIYDVLREEFLAVPQNHQKWLEIAQDFETRWNLPHCVGAIDGKHVAIQKPPNCGSEYYNYKGFHSIVLFAVVDASYKFVYLDVGCNGRVSDGGVLLNSSLYSALENNELNMPPPTPLSDRQMEMPYFFVGDEAFALKSYMMRPYPAKSLTHDRRIFNYRLSRARRIVENVFGILTNRFGVLQRPMKLGPEGATHVVLACCALHNFLTKTSSCRVYCPPPTLNREHPVTRELIPGECAQPLGNGLRPLQAEHRQRSNGTAHAYRDELTDYFNTNGNVPWQWDRAFAD